MGKLWRLALPLIFGFAAVAVIAVIALAILGWQTDSDALAARLEAARLGLDGVRLVAMATLVTLWGPLVRWRGRRRDLAPETVAALAEHRWTLALVLLAIELVLVQNLPGRLWEWLP